MRANGKSEIVLFILLLLSLLLILSSCRKEKESNIPKPHNFQPATLEYYKGHSIMTNPGKYAHLYDELPETIPQLCQTVQGLLLHVFHTERYGVSLSEERKKEVRLRKVEDMLQCLIDLQDQSLILPRNPDERIISHCRDYAVLLCSFLRHKGIPARVRAGFATYFIAGSHQSHWVCEYWNRANCRWVQVDAQLDEIQSEYYGIDFDPLDLPAGKFIFAGIFYQMVKQGDIDTTQQDAGQLTDLGLARRNIIRDLAALNKMELEIWDLTELMDQERHPISETTVLINEIVEITTSDEDRLSEQQKIYEMHSELRMPMGWNP